VEIEYNTEPVDYQGIKLAFGPKILMDPSFAITIKELKEKFVGKNKIGKDATLILANRDTKVENLTFAAGFKKVNPDEKNTTLSGEIDNAGEVKNFVPTKGGEPEYLQLRCYYLE